MTTLGERTSYGLYFTGQNIFYMLVTTYLVTYLMFLGIDLSKTATIMLIVKVWDALNDALFGAVFDKVHFKSGRKCLPWLRISAAFIPVTTILLFIIPQGAPEAVKLAWFAIAYLLWDTAYTFCDVPIFTMVTTMTDRLDERNSLMARGRIFSGGGMAVAGILCTVLISEKVGLGFGAVSVLLSVLGCLLMLPICVNGKERNYHVEHEEETFTLREMLRYLIHNKYLLLYYGGSVISGSLATAGTLGMFASYYFFGSAVFNLFLTALSALPAVLLAFFTPAILRRVDKFKFFIACNVFSAVFGIVIYFIGYQNVPLFVLLSVIRAIPAGAIGVVGFMFTPDCAEYGQYHAESGAPPAEGRLPDVFFRRQRLPYLGHAPGQHYDDSHAHIQPRRIPPRGISQVQHAEGLDGGRGNIRHAPVAGRLRKDDGSQAADRSRQHQNAG